MNMTELGLKEYEIAFPGLGIERLAVKSEAFSIGGFSVAWYGVIIACGMILAIIFGMSQMKKYGIDPDRAIDVVIGGIIGGVVGARAYYVAMNWEQYSSDLKTIFYTRNGGLAIYGGIIGALLVGVIMCRIRKVKILPLFDLAGMGFLIGQGIGRWGNFFNHEAFGYNTDLPWGMTSGKIQRWITEYSTSISSDPKVIEMSADRAVHPCFLYESIWCLVGFAVLFAVSKHRKYDGQIFLLYIFWYGLGRSFIEGLRTDSLMLGNIRVSQLLAILSVITSFILLIAVGSKVKRMGDDYVFYKDTEESKALIMASENAMKEANEKKAQKKNKKAKAEDEEYKPIAAEENETENSAENEEK